MTEHRLIDGGIPLIRPLLDVRRLTLLDYLHQSKITYRTDSSNRDLGFTGATACGSN